MRTASSSRSAWRETTGPSFMVKINPWYRTCGMILHNIVCKHLNPDIFNLWWSKTCNIYIFANEKNMILLFMQFFFRRIFFIASLSCQITENWFYIKFNNHGCKYKDCQEIKEDPSQLRFIYRDYVDKAEKLVCLYIQVFGGRSN